MLRQSCALVLAWAATAAAQCSAAYGDCFNTTCCANGNFGCMRKVGKHFAQCRPMPGGVCQESADWDCPGWERCTEKYATCTETKCCKDAGFACFRKPQADYAQCRPIDSHSACSDTAEWLCPGWQLCSDPYQACTATHCCADRRFTCYQKHPHFAQCMRRGACVAGRDGDCEVTQNLLGQCSAPFHDCHLTGCCQRGEDHCYLKNEFYGQCRPSCSKAELGQDWSCVRRELPREKNKVTCEVLRTRNNIYHRPCSTQYESAGQCNLAFSSSDNLYQPCVWDTGTNACKEAGQVLACDCALKHKNCPQHENGAAQTAEEDDGEGAIIAFALIIIVGGCAGVGWCALVRTRPALFLFGLETHACMLCLRAGSSTSGMWRREMRRWTLRTLMTTDQRIRRRSGRRRRVRWSSTRTSCERLSEDPPKSIGRTVERVKFV